MKLHLSLCKICHASFLAFSSNWGPSLISEDPVEIRTSSVRVSRARQLCMATKKRPTNAPLHTLLLTNHPFHRGDGANMHSLPVVLLLLLLFELSSSSLRQICCLLSSYHADNRYFLEDDQGGARGQLAILCATGIMIRIRPAIEQKRLACSNFCVLLLCC